MHLPGLGILDSALANFEIITLHLKIFDAQFGHIFDFDIQDLHVSALEFIDDLYLICKNPRESQTMLDELIQTIADSGLSMNSDDSSWMCDKHCWDDWCNSELNFGSDNWIKPTTSLNVLGSIISFGSEQAAIKHRISQSWRCFRKWQHILIATATLKSKITFRTNTFFRCFTGGLQMARRNEHLISFLASAQN